MEWFTKSNNIRNAERQPACNVVERPIGSLGAAKSFTTPPEAWRLFGKDEFLEKKFLPTQIKRLKSSKVDFKKHSELLQSILTYCRVTDLIEIKAFSELCYLRRTINFNTTNTDIDLYRSV